MEKGGRSMSRLLPVLHEGHAPIYLHQAFAEALDAYEQWQLGGEEPLVFFEDGQVPISAVFGRMRRCTDILPIRILEDVSDISGQLIENDDAAAITYADAAHVMRARCVQRLKGDYSRLHRA
jgi:hypothetical protein